MLPNQRPYYGPVYTDKEVNGLLDTIFQLQETRRFLRRENKRVVMLCQFMQMRILRLKSANEAFEEIQRNDSQDLKQKAG